MRKPAFSYAKTKTQISFAVTAKLISAFVLATRIEQFLYFIYTKFQASSHLVLLYSLIYVGPGRKPRRPVFSQRGSYTYILRLYMMILVPVLHFSNPLSSSRSSCSVLNIEYLRMALRLVSQPSDNARVRGSVKENTHSSSLLCKYQSFVI